MRKILLKGYHSILYFSSLFLKSSVGGHCSIKWTIFVAGKAGLMFLSSNIVLIFWEFYMLTLTLFKSTQISIWIKGCSSFYIFCFESQVFQSLLSWRDAQQSINSVSLTQILCPTCFLLSHCVTFSLTFSGFIIEWEILLAEGTAILFCISMYYLQWRNLMWKAGENSHGVIIIKYFLNETGNSFENEEKTVNWSSFHWLATSSCSSWKPVTREVNLQNFIWTEGLSMLATLIYREETELFCTCNSTAPYDQDYLQEIWKPEEWSRWCWDKELCMKTMDYT